MKIIGQYSSTIGEVIAPSGSSSSNDAEKQYGVIPCGLQR
jgi:hypothetical protein